MGLLGTMMAFMYFNLFGNAEKFTKTFMGDTGSLILGYSITYLSIKYSMYNPQVFPVQSCPILVAYTLVLVPVLDLIRVAIERVSLARECSHLTSGISIIFVWQQVCLCTKRWLLFCHCNLHSTYWIWHCLSTYQFRQRLSSYLMWPYMYLSLYF